jgi:hypothetical protein
MINIKKCIATLVIPSGSILIQPIITYSDDIWNIYKTYISDKMRTNQAIPIKITYNNININKPCFSCYGPSFAYAIDNLAKTKLNRDESLQCTEGIHIFATREEAEYYI